MTFEKISGVRPLGTARAALYASRGNAVTAECNNRWVEVQGQGCQVAKVGGNACREESHADFFFQFLVHFY